MYYRSNIRFSQIHKMLFLSIHETVNFYRFYQILDKAFVINISLKLKPMQLISAILSILYISYQNTLFLGVILNGVKFKIKILEFLELSAIINTYFETKFCNLRVILFTDLSQFFNGMIISIPMVVDFTKN